MSLHRYHGRSVAADYARGLAGGLLGAGGVAAGMPSMIPTVIFGGLTALFILFTMRTALRHHRAIEMTGEAIGVAGRPRKVLGWAEIDDVRLRFFATRRNRSDGWMTLTLKSGGRRLAVDSTIEGFDRIAAGAAAAAQANRLALNPTTAANFGALGLEIAGTAPGTDMRQREGRVG
jgi:hypothetical protein